MVMEDPLTWIFVVTVALATALALIAVRGNLSIVARAGALGLTAMLLLTSYNGFTELMSRPKPATLEWVRGGESPATVTASHLRENEAIYLWLVFKGETEPRAYSLPWDIEVARQLRRAERQARERQSSVLMKSLRHTDSNESEPVFHVPPRPAPPPKLAQAD